MMTDKFPKRKRNRLIGYDYNTANAYFITICTDKRRNILWDNANAAVDCPEDVRLSPCGRLVDRAIRNITEHYPAVSVDHYAIMPNHVHLLLQINTDDDGRPMVAPTMSTVIQQMKGSVSKQIGFSIWQKGFYDHVVRGESDYLQTWNYIEGNPSKWTEDQLYSDQ